MEGNRGSAAVATRRPGVESAWNVVQCLHLLLASIRVLAHLLVNLGMPAVESEQYRDALIAQAAAIVLVGQLQAIGVYEEG